MLLLFGPFELDLSAGELRRDGRRVALQPRIFDTLRYLIEHRDRVVTPRELIDILWAGQPLNSMVVTWSIARARRALDENGSYPGYIRTVRGHGYRFIGGVRASTPSAVQSGERVVRGDTLLDASDPFLGREAVISQLMAALEAAQGGSGRLVLITGEPGIGKTRCTQEFSAISRRLGYATWAGRCVDRVASPAFWPFIQVLREACSDPSLPGVDRYEAQELLGQLIPDRANSAESEAPESGVARSWIVDRLSRLRVRTGTTRPRIITFDDLQSADENSLRTLALLAPLLERARLLVIAASRDTAADPERSLRPPERACSTRRRPMIRKGSSTGRFRGMRRRAASMLASSTPSGSWPRATPAAA